MTSPKGQQGFGVVYKYVQPERIDVLRNSKIRFTQPMALNDPFEFLPGLGEFGKKQLETMLSKNREELGELGEAVAQFFGPGLLLGAHQQLPNVFGRAFALLSLSRTCNNIIMWSHYASQHSGFVIGLDSATGFFSPGGTRAVDGLQEVMYSDQRQGLPADGFLGLTEEERDILNRGILYTKSTTWAYEQELRIFAHPKDADEVVRVDGAPDILLYTLPSECIREVILGVRMAEGAKAELVTLIREKFPKVGVYLASIHESDYSLRLTRVDLTKPFPPPGLPGSTLKWSVSEGSLSPPC